MDQIVEIGLKPTDSIMNKSDWSASKWLSFIFDYDFSIIQTTL